MVAFAAVVVASLSLPTVARAQAVYGSVAGTVTDSSGAAAPDVRLTLVSLERKTIDNATSNASGFYLKDRLLPGAYSVEAVRAGFREVLVPSVTVYVDTQTRVDLVLHPGPVTESVTRPSWIFSKVHQATGRGGSTGDRGLLMATAPRNTAPGRSASTTARSGRSARSRPCARRRPA